MGSIIGSLFTLIFSPILYLIYSVFWGIFITFFWALLEGIYTFTKFISFDLLNLLLFNKSSGSNVNPLSIFSSLPRLFLVFALFSILIFTLLFVIVLIKHSQNQKTESGKMPLKVALKNAFPAIITIAALPLLVLVINILLSLIVGTIEQHITNPHLTLISNKPPSAIQSIYYTVNNHEQWVLDNFNKSPTNPLQWYAPMSLTQYINFAVHPQQSLNLGLSIVKLIIINLILIWFIVEIAINVFKQIIFQFVLFISSPLVSTMSISDDGRKLKTWKDSYFKSILTVVVNILSISLFVWLIYHLYDKIKISSSSEITKNNTWYAGAEFLNTIIIHPFATAGAAFGLKYFLGFIHSKLGTQAFSLAKGLKSFGSKASQGSSFIKKGGAVKSLLAGAAGGGAVGIAAGLFAAGKMAISRNRNASTLAKTTGMSKQTASSILSSPGLKLNEQQQKMFTQNISKSGLDLSKVNSMSELQTQLRVKEQLVDQEVSKLQQDKRYGSNTAPKFNEKTHRIMEELATIKQNNEMLNSILSQGGQTNASE